MTGETATEKRLRELAYIASVDGRSDLQPEDEEHLNIARKAFALLRDDKNKFRSPVMWEQDRQLLLARASDLQRPHDVSGNMPELQRDADRASETVEDAGVHSAREDAGRLTANIVRADYRREGDGPFSAWQRYIHERNMKYWEQLLVCRTCGHELFADGQGGMTCSKLLLHGAAPSVGDVVKLAGFGLREVPNADTARVLQSNDGVDAIYRCIWSREQP